MTKKTAPMLSKISMYHMVDGKRVDGTHKDLTGNVADLSGNVTNIRGDVTGLWGNVAVLSGKGNCKADHRYHRTPC